MAEEGGRLVMSEVRGRPAMKTAEVGAAAAAERTNVEFGGHPFVGRRKCENFLIITKSLNPKIKNCEWEYQILQFTVGTHIEILFPPNSYN